MKILLDTNFILECIKNKIDFSDIDGCLLIPKQVILELEKIASSMGEKYSENAHLALEIIGKNKDKFQFIALESEYADLGILKYAEKNKGIAVATIDKELKRKLKGVARILIIMGRKKLELV